MPIAVLASVGPPTIPEKTKQSIIDRRSSAAGERQISNLLGPAETAANGFVYGHNRNAIGLDGPHRIGGA